MHVEIIGTTSAGKTTLARKMVKAGKDNGIDVFLSDDFMLEKVHLDWVKNEFVRRRLVELVAFAVWLTCLARYKDFYNFVLQEGKYNPGSWFYKINRVRNVVRKIGVFEFIARKSESGQVILVDNEGILQGVHNLFVHQDSTADLSKIPTYVKLVPLPDVILYLNPGEEVLVSRTLARGHARVESEQDKVIHFIRQAACVFDEMAKLPVIQKKLLVTNGQLDIKLAEEDRVNHNFQRVVELIRAGSILS
jgi:thymidylate kinase